MRAFADAGSGVNGDERFAFVGISSKQREMTACNMILSHPIDGLGFNVFEARQCEWGSLLSMELNDFTIRLGGLLLRFPLLIGIRANIHARGVSVVPIFHLLKFL